MASLTGRVGVRPGAEGLTGRLASPRRPQAGLVCHRMISTVIRIFP
jgi:hypothetical protein